MKKYIKPEMMKFDVDTVNIIADSQVDIQDVSGDPTQQSNLNLSTRVKQKNIWDEQW